MSTPATNPLALPTPETPERNGTSGPSLADRVRSLRLPASDGGGGDGGGSWLAWGLVLALGCGAGYLGYRWYLAEIALAEAATATTGTGTGIGTGPGNPGTPTTTTGSPSSGRALETGGYLIPVRRVQVSPRVGGQVIKMFYEEGQQVQAGMPLAIVDRTKYLFAFRERKAQTESLRHEWERLKTTLRIEEEIRSANVLEGQASFSSSETKYRIAINGGRGVSDEELKTARWQMDMTSARLKNLQGMLKVTRETAQIEIDRAGQNYQQALTAAQSAEDDLDNSVVAAPSSGTILKKYAEDGNMVRPEAFSNGLSASLYDIADLSQMEVEVDISERDLEVVFLNQKCEVRMEAFPDKVYTGHVARIQPEASRSKASVSARVRVEVPEGDRYLRPELRARVRFFPAAKTK